MTRSDGLAGDRGIALALAAVLFALYALGACRTIYVGDSGELVAAVHVLGIPHPSGYPLYVLLGKLWTVLLPLGSIAFRMSLFSAACAAGTCAVIYLLARRLGCAPPSAIAASLLLAFAPSFWGEANVQRVYALNALFVALATYAALVWWLERRAGALACTVFLCALGAANHTFMGVYGVVFGVFALATDGAAVLRPRTLAWVLAAGALGLLPYAYLPIASSFDPPLDWGNPETWDALSGGIAAARFLGARLDRVSGRPAGRSRSTTSKDSGASWRGSGRSWRSPGGCSPRSAASRRSWSRSWSQTFW